MSNKEPYELRSILLLYNFLQITCNLYLAATGLWYSYLQDDFDYFGKYHYHHRNRIELVYVCYVFFWSKIFDLLDTVFFVLRKKSNQISFLHTYHHSTMIIVEYIHNKYFAGK